MCPRCQRASLMALGDFWICDVCGLVIIDQGHGGPQPVPAVPAQPTAERVPADASASPSR